MKSLFLSFIPLFFFMASLSAQDSPLPYREIPPAPDDFSVGNVLSRLIDGLGFRYYWATEGLRPEDLAFRPTPESRSAGETLEHVYGLSLAIANVTESIPNIRSTDAPELSFEEKRKATLENFAKASQLLKGKKKKHIKKMKIIFQRGENSSEYPFWNMLNGQIADALWHTGQIVSFRRSSGNPFNSKASVFSGKVRE